MTVTLQVFVAKVVPDMKGGVRLALKEAVNRSALDITRDARARVQAKIGSEQRLSGYLYNRTGSKVGGTVTEAGGRRINPAYKKADSNVHPVALIGARGPAHFIEHSRQGGYEIGPAKFRLGPKSGAGYRKALVLLGYDPEEAASMASGAERRRAISLPPYGEDDRRAHVKGGAIHRSGGPILAAFAAAPATVRRNGEKILQDALKRMKA